MRISDWSSDVCSSDLPSMSEPLLSLTFIARSSLLLRDRHMTASASIVGMGQDLLDANRVLGAIAHSEEHPAAFPKPQKGNTKRAEDGKVLAGRMTLMRINEESVLGRREEHKSE